MQRRNQFEYEEQFRGGRSTHGQYFRGEEFSWYQEFDDDGDEYFRQQIRILWSHRHDPDFKYYQQQARRNLYQHGEFYEEERFVRQSVRKYQGPLCEYYEGDRFSRPQIQTHSYPYQQANPYHNPYPTQAKPETNQQSNLYNNRTPHYPHFSPHTNPHVNPQTNPQNRERYIPQPNQQPNRPHEYIFDGDARLTGRPARASQVRHDDGMKQGCFQTQEQLQSPTSELKYKTDTEEDLIETQNGDLQRLRRIVEEERGQKEEALGERAQEDGVKAQIGKARNEMFGKNTWVTGSGHLPPTGALIGSAISTPTPNPPLHKDVPLTHVSPSKPKSTAAAVIDLRSTAIEATERSSGDPPILRFTPIGIGDSPKIGVTNTTSAIVTADEADGTKLMDIGAGPTTILPSKQFSSLRRWVSRYHWLFHCWGLSPTQENMSSFLSRVVQGTFDHLEDSGCIKMKGDVVDSMAMSSLASRGYLSYKTVLMFRLNIGPDLSLKVFVAIYGGRRYEHSLFIFGGEDIPICGSRLGDAVNVKSRKEKGHIIAVFLVLLTLSSGVLAISWFFAPYNLNPSGLEWQKFIVEFEELINWLLSNGGEGVRTELSLPNVGEIIGAVEEINEDGAEEHLQAVILGKFDVACVQCNVFYTGIFFEYFGERGKHYTCMVDLLSRAGRLDEAQNLLRNMPFKPDAATWGAVLGAYRTHGHTELGDKAAAMVTEMEPDNDGMYVLLSNLYAASGRWQDVRKVRLKMKDQGVKKVTGFSWLEVQNKIHTFSVGDTNHPEIGRIYAYLKELELKMKKDEYVYSTKLVLHDIVRGDNTPRLPRLLINGPYGALAKCYRKYDVFLLVEIFKGSGVSLGVGCGFVLFVNVLSEFRRSYGWGLIPASFFWFPP